MKKGRSQYNYSFNCDMNQVNQLIQSYLNANGYKFIQKKSESFYRGGDQMKGYWYFNYYINGNNLTIFAWVKGLLGELSLENDFVGNLTIMPYRNSLNILFQELNNLNSQNGGMMNNSENNNMNNNYDNDMNNEINNGVNNNMDNNMNGVMNNDINNDMNNNMNNEINNNMGNNMNTFNGMFGMTNNNNENNVNYDQNINNLTEMSNINNNMNNNYIENQMDYNSNNYNNANNDINNSNNINQMENNMNNYNNMPNMNNNSIKFGGNRTVGKNNNMMLILGGVGIIIVLIVIYFIFAGGSNTLKCSGKETQSGITIEMVTKLKFNNDILSSGTFEENIDFSDASLSDYQKEYLSKKDMCDISKFPSMRFSVDYVNCKQTMNNNSMSINADIKPSTTNESELTREVLKNSLEREGFTCK